MADQWPAWLDPCGKAGEVNTFGLATPPFTDLYRPVPASALASFEESPLTSHMRSTSRLYEAILRLLASACACITIVASTAVRVAAQDAKVLPEAELVGPGQPGLNPHRVLESLDTLALLVTAPSAAERSYATLVRRIIRTSADGIPVLRETQHYEFANGTRLDDTLDVSASTLAPLRYFSADHQGTFDVNIEDKRIGGWRTDSAGARTDVRATATHSFFVSIMSEGFVAALPLDVGATINVPMADPPAPAVRAVTLHVKGLETLQTARGPVPCILVVGPGNTETWIARDDHHLVRMHWMLPDGTSVWKLPARDASLRGGNTRPARQRS